MDHKIGCTRLPLITQMTAAWKQYQLEKAGYVLMILEITTVLSKSHLAFSTLQKIPGTDVEQQATNVMGNKLNFREIII